MPTSISAKKRLRQNEAHRERNRSRRTAIKTRVRSFLDAVHDKDASRAQEQFRLLTKSLDQAVAKGTFHKNTVSRKKSRMAARLNALTAPDK